MIRSALLVFWAVAACAHAPTATTTFASTAPSPLTTLHVLAPEEGLRPRASMALGPDGAEYGIASLGGSSCGTVFRWDGSYHVIHTFAPLDASGRNPDGCNSTAPVSFHGGRLYAVMRAGGTGGNPARQAPGAITSMLLDGSDVRLEHAFTTGADGASPMGGLVWVGDVAYGATPQGIYRWTPGGAIVYVHTFASLVAQPDGTRTNVGGAAPYGTPVFGGDNWFHGATVYGGTHGAGAMYAFDPTTGASRVEFDFAAYTFGGNTDNTPMQSPMLASNGAVYYAAPFGGPNGTGVLVKVECGHATVIHEFGPWITTSTPTAPRFSSTDGLLPIGTLVEFNGWIYGVTVYGGASGTGAVFRIRLDGSGFQLVASFRPSPGNVVGCYPLAGLTVTADGKLLGSTSLCGQGGGTIIEIDP